jgi:hypothetical protein
VAIDALPTAGMGWDAFEAFLDDLLVRLRLVDASPRLVDSYRYGTQGQAQDGIDHVGEYDDGSKATFQCKEQQRLTDGDIDDIISRTTYDAMRHVIVYSRVASADARRKVGAIPAWSICDARDLANLVRSLPLHEGRTLLDTHFDVQFRHRFLPLAGTDVFLPWDEYFAPLLRSGIRFSHTWELVGRNGEVATLLEALLAENGPAIIIVEGPAGRGKSRLVLEMLRRFAEIRSGVPMLVRSENRQLDSDAVKELPDCECLLVAEDAHRDPGGVAALLSFVRRTPRATVVITTRPSGAAAVEDAMVAAQFDSTEVLHHPLDPLSLPEARNLVSVLAGSDVELSGEFAEGLAKEARPTPLVAVLAVALIRRGELTAPLGVDRNFRSEILRRYGAAVADGVEGVPAEVVQATLALIAAIGPIGLDNLEKLEAMAAFLGVDRPELLATLTRLADNGVVLERDRRIQVVPDVIGDLALERMAVSMGVDTGYVARLWKEFGSSTPDLVPVIAELDWRVKHGTTDNGGNAPDLFAALGQEIIAAILPASNAERVAILALLRPVAATQPGFIVDLVDTVLANPADDDNPGGYGLTHANVTTSACELLGICARVDVSVLDRVLDLLWRLARVDASVACR